MSNYLTQEAQRKISEIEKAIRDGERILFEHRTLLERWRELSAFISQVENGSPVPAISENAVSEKRVTQIEKIKNTILYFGKPVGTSEIVKYLQETDAILRSKPRASVIAMVSALISTNMDRVFTREKKENGRYIYGLKDEI